MVEPADVDWRGMLAAIGIVKGQPFKPDDRTKAILNEAAKTAFKTSKVLAFDIFPAKKEDLVYNGPTVDQPAARQLQYGRP